MGKSQVFFNVGVSVLLGITLFLVFFGAPAFAVLVGVIFLENVDTTLDKHWRLGAKDPFRFIAHDSDGKIRPWFKPTVAIIVGVYLGGLLFFVVFVGP